MQDISIQEPTETDLNQIAPLLAELMDALKDKAEFDLEAAAGNFRSLLKDPQSHFLVARYGETVVGFVNFMTRNTILHSKPSALIDELVVAREYRGHGIGRWLVSAAMQKCKGLGCCELEVSTEKANRAARRFYKSCGFEEVCVFLEAALR